MTTKTKSRGPQFNFKPSTSRARKLLEAFEREAKTTEQKKSYIFMEMLRARYGEPNTKGATQ
jgi:hypothetical protein